MKRQLLFLALLTMCSVQLFSQIQFENGYFINDSDQKIECLIKNVDWKNNPTEFEYKVSEDATVQKASISSVKEFGINGFPKNIRASVKIDRSSDQMNKMGSEKNPVFQEETLFLKVLIESKASLFVYEDGNLTRYFYSLSDSEIKQLIYKKYFVDNVKMAENNSFRQQLFTDLKCEGITLNDVKNLIYAKKDLEKIFTKYNKCTNASISDQAPKQKRDLFNLSLRPGLNYSSLAMSYNLNKYLSIDFGNELGFRFGIEGEYILPFNRNKWGLIVEPTYQQFKSEKIHKPNANNTFFAEANYASIELPIGVRHYFFLNEDSKIFVDVSAILDFNIGPSDIKIMRSDGSTIFSLDIDSQVNAGLGIGYKYKNRYSLGMRYQTNREILNGYLYWDSDYNTFSVIFGYSVF
jgi:hypothetical protein